MAKDITKHQPFDHLRVNRDKYHGVKLDITSADEDKLDFAFVDSNGKRLDKFELYPLVAMLADTQLNKHPAWSLVDSVLADFDVAWSAEYQSRTAENN